MQQGAPQVVVLRQPGEARLGGSGQVLILLGVAKMGGLRRVATLWALLVDRLIASVYCFDGPGLRVIG